MQLTSDIYTPMFFDLCCDECSHGPKRDGRRPFVQRRRHSFTFEILTHALSCVYFSCDSVMRNYRLMPVSVKKEIQKSKACKENDVFFHANDIFYQSFNVGYDNSQFSFNFIL